jgi:diaminopimelate epimerase
VLSLSTASFPFRFQGGWLHDLPFSKGHGLGNDYLVIEKADLRGDVSPALVRAICDRNRGPG